MWEVAGGGSAAAREGDWEEFLAWGVGKVGAPGLGERGLGGVPVFLHLERVGVGVRARGPVTNDE